MLYFQKFASFLGLSAQAAPEHSTSSNPVAQRLQRADAQIDDICRASGVAGASIGVIRNGTLIHEHYCGFADVESRIPAELHTVYDIGSLTKSFISATIAQLVDESRKTAHPVTFDTLVKDLLPEFNHDCPTINSMLTLNDILTHRSGLASTGAMNLAFQGDGDMLLPKESLFQIVNHLPVLSPLRQSWSYFVWGYALAGTWIERFTGRSLGEAVADKVLGPLELNETYFDPADVDERLLARPYAGLSDGTAFRLPKHQVFEGTFFEASGGVYSSLSDMAKWCTAMLRSIHDARSGGKSSNSPIKHVSHLVSNMIPIHNPSIRERSYGLGWIRTQLPNVVGVMGDNAGLWPMEEGPVLGTDQTPIFMLYHQGSTVGYYSHMALFPDADTAVVVLTNSIAISDAPDWISRVLTQALFDLQDGNDYVALAKDANRRVLEKFDQLASDIKLACPLPPALIENGRPRSPAARLRSQQRLAGRYISESKLFFIDILSPSNDNDSEESDSLRMRFQGLADQTYDLRHLCDSTYEWFLQHDESKKRGRYNQLEKSLYLIKFDEARGSLSWTIDSELPGSEGDEVFYKTGASHGYGRHENSAQ